MRARSAEDEDGQNDMPSLRQIEFSDTEALAEHAYDNWAGYGIGSEDRTQKRISVAFRVKTTVSLADIK